MKKIKIIALLITILVSSPAWADDNVKIVKEGNRLFADGEYEQSLDKFKEALENNPESDIINFNLGTAYYKSENYLDAALHFQKSLLSENDDLKQKSYYNIGNSFYQHALSRERETELEDAVDGMKQSVEHYKRAIEFLENEDTRHNFDIAQSELSRLEKLLQEMQQDQQDSKDQSESEKDQQEDQEQQESSENEEQEEESEDKQEPSDKPSDKEEQSDEESENESDDSSDSDGSPEEEEQDQNSSQDEEPSEEDSQSSSEDDDSEESSSRPPQPQNSEDMTEKEVEMMLKNFEQTEEPDGLFNPQRFQANYDDVKQDW